MLLTAKVLFLLLALFVGVPLAVNAARNNVVHWIASLFLAIGIVGFIACQWWIP